MKNVFAKSSMVPSSQPGCRRAANPFVTAFLAASAGIILPNCVAEQYPSDGDKTPILSVCSVKVAPFGIISEPRSSPSIFCANDGIFAAGKVYLGQALKIFGMEIVVTGMSESVNDGKSNSPNVSFTISHYGTVMAVNLQKSVNLLFHSGNKTVSLKANTIAADCEPKWVDLEIVICPGPE